MSRPPFALLDDVHVRREGNTALVELPGQPRTVVWIELGPSARTLSDQEILDRHHHHVLATIEQGARAPQVYWDDAAGCWRPYGRLVRCALEVGPTLGEPVMVIDELELTLAELGRMLVEHGAHVGMVFFDD
jgi:hypothetical protein